jgi:26S proteasome regulatory subunit N3
VSSGAGDAMEVETKGEAEVKAEIDVPRTTVIPEVRWYKIIGCDDILHPHFPYFIFVMPTIQKLQVEVYISLLVLTTLMQQGSANAKRCAEASASLFNSVQSLNRRSMDLLRAKVFHYFSLTHELYLGNISTLRPTLLEAHRMACIQHDEMGQATLLNLLLRSLLEENQVCIVVSFCWNVTGRLVLLITVRVFKYIVKVEQAYKLVSKTNFPEKASNNQFCRYLYYTGRISALQLEYGDAHEKLKSSLRKGYTSFSFCNT